MVWYLNSFSKTIFNTLTQFWFHWFSISFLQLTTIQNSIRIYMCMCIHFYIHQKTFVSLRGLKDSYVWDITCLHVVMYNNRILCFDNVYFLHVQVLNCGNRRHSCIKEYIIKCQCRNYTIIERNTRTSHVLTACGTRVLIRYICRALQLLTHTALGCAVLFALHACFLRKKKSLGFFHLSMKSSTCKFRTIISIVDP